MVVLEQERAPHWRVMRKVLRDRINLAGRERRTGPAAGDELAKLITGH